MPVGFLWNYRFPSQKGGIRAQTFEREKRGEKRGRRANKGKRRKQGSFAVKMKKGKGSTKKGAAVVHLIIHRTHRKSAKRGKSAS